MFKKAILSWSTNQRIFLVSLINCIFVKSKVKNMVKFNLKNILLLMGGAFLIILILALIGVDMSKPVPYGGVILCCVVTISATGKWISSLNKKENENK